MRAAAIDPDLREAILLSCSGLGAGRAGASDVSPLGPAGWFSLVSRLQPARLAAADLFELGVSGFTARLGYSAGDGERLDRLFARRTQVAFELERLERLGLWAATLADAEYPDRLRERLGKLAPPVLFGAGDRSLLSLSGIAIVGSRDADEGALGFAATAAGAAAVQQFATISGAARGVDGTAMRAAFEAGGVVIGVLAESLEARVRQPSTREALAAGLVALLTPYRPDAPFSVGAAMGRNKIVYALSDLAIVVSSTEGSGGTWAGAVESLEHRWVPVFAWTGNADKDRNGALLRRGAHPVGLDALGDLRGLVASAPGNRPLDHREIEVPTQQPMFDDE